MSSIYLEHSYTPWELCQTFLQFVLVILWGGQIESIPNLQSSTKVAGFPWIYAEICIMMNRLPLTLSQTPNFGVTYTFGSQKLRYSTIWGARWLFSMDKAVTLKEKQKVEIHQQTVDQYWDLCSHQSLLGVFWTSKMTSYLIYMFMDDGLSVKKTPNKGLRTLNINRNRSPVI